MTCQEQTTATFDLVVFRFREAVSLSYEFHSVYSTNLDDPSTEMSVDIQTTPDCGLFMPTTKSHSQTGSKSICVARRIRIVAA